jgi:hypothetical protein
LNLAAAINDCFRKYPATASIIIKIENAVYNTFELQICPSR